MKGPEAMMCMLQGAAVRESRSMCVYRIRSDILMERSCVLGQEPRWFPASYDLGTFLRDEWEVVLEDDE